MYVAWSVSRVFTATCPTEKCKPSCQITRHFQSFCVAPCIFARSLKPRRLWYISNSIGKFLSAFIKAKTHFMTWPRVQAICLCSSCRWFCGPAGQIGDQSKFKRRNFGNTLLKVLNPYTFSASMAHKVNWSSCWLWPNCWPWLVFFVYRYQSAERCKYWSVPIARVLHFKHDL